MPVTQEDIQTYAPRLLLIRHTGVILWWMQQSYYFRGEPEKLRPQLISITLKNLFFGWWSIASFFINPVVTIANWVRFAHYGKEYQRYVATPEQYVREAKQAAEDAAVRKSRNQKRTFKVLGVVLGVFAVLFVLGLIVD